MGMKISKRKIGILFIFVIVILMESISFATYQTAVLGETHKKDTMPIEEITKQENAILTPEEQKTLDLINEYRKSYGMEALKPLISLQEVAQLKAEDLVENSYFSHTSYQLGTPFEMLKNHGIDYKIAGENLSGNTTPERAVDAWIHSDSHRENMLESKFNYTGIYVMESPIYGKVFVQIFIGI